METRSRKYGCSSIRRESTPTRRVTVAAGREARPLRQSVRGDRTGRRHNHNLRNLGVALSPSAALILNATKHLAGIDYSVKLIPQEMIEPDSENEDRISGGHNPRLHTDEVLVALSVLSQADERCRRALRNFLNSEAVRVHSTVMLSEVDRKIFRKLGVGLTCEPVLKKHKS